MKQKDIYLKMVRLVLLSLCLPVALLFITSCSDEPDQENYYTFKGEMMSTYLKERSQYSLFAKVLEKASFMGLLSSRGAYTCFAPTNTAMQEFLASRGLSSVDGLSVEDCDTLARTHLLSIMCSTYNMPEGVLTQPNMNDRYLEISYELDVDNNTIVCINGDTHLDFYLQDDSVENGIVHTIDKVLQSSSDMLPDVIAENPNISIFNNALQLTGLKEKLFRYKDETYVMPVDKDDPTEPAWHPYNTGGDVNNPIKEVARPPKERLFGFTAFIVPDSVLAEKYGITTAEGLYKQACTIYSAYYSGQEDQDYYKFENAKDPRNPLYRLIAYHLLNRNVHGYNLLTVREDIGIDVNKMDPTEWYETMLPYAMMKVQKVMVPKYLKGAKRTHRFINRRIDNQYSIPGVHIQPIITDGHRGEALNGFYFYIDDLLAYDKTVTEEVMNCRMRMDMSAVFPELSTNSIRMNYKGNGLWEAGNDQVAASKDERWGTNYYFPNGYLDGVTVANNGYFVYRRPRYTFWSYSGDEFVCNGSFDITLRIPPVPSEGDYQIRLGYAAMSVRGIAQVYFDGTPQGIPLDMRRDMTNEALLGATYWNAHNDEYNSKMTDEEKVQERKDLKNKGFYRGANGAYRKGSAGETGQPFAEIAATIRIVLCTTHIKPGEDHYLRFRCVSEGLGNNEIMLDYLEIVPKSVYGVSDEGVQEDDL